MSDTKPWIQEVQKMPSKISRQCKTKAENPHTPHSNCKKSKNVEESWVEGAPLWRNKERNYSQLLSATLQVREN